MLCRGVPLILVLMLLLLTGCVETGQLSDGSGVGDVSEGSDGHVFVSLVDAYMTDCFEYFYIFNESEEDFRTGCSSDSLFVVVLFDINNTKDYLCFSSFNYLFDVDGNRYLWYEINPFYGGGRIEWSFVEGAVNLNSLEDGVLVPFFVGSAVLVYEVPLGCVPDRVVLSVGFRVNEFAVVSGWETFVFDVSDVKA